MLSLQNINLTLGKQPQLQRSILQDLSIDLVAGEFIVVVGGNGAGKSSLCNIIAGALIPDAGNIIFAKQDITQTPQLQRAAIISNVMQDPRIGTMENLTILENLAFAYRRGNSRSLLPFTNKSRRKLFAEKLALLNMGLEYRMDELVSNLSGGQRQALSLIMAIIADCKLLLLDEITAALDPHMARQVIEIANHIVREQKLTCIMITHNMQHALDYGDKILVLNHGKIVRQISGHEKNNFTAEKLAVLLHAAAA